PRVSVTRRIAQAFCQSRNDCSGSSFEAALIAPERFICPPGDRLASGAARKRALGPERFEPQVTSAAGGGHHTNGPSSPPCGQGSTGLQFLVLAADLHARPALADLPPCLRHSAFPLVPATDTMSATSTPAPAGAAVLLRWFV